MSADIGPGYWPWSPRSAYNNLNKPSNHLAMGNNMTYSLLASTVYTSMFFCLGCVQQPPKVLIELKENLKVFHKFRDERSTVVASQQFLKDYMSTSLALGTSVESLEEQLQELCKADKLISEEIYQQTLSELHPIPSATEATPDSVTVEPLFTKDTVYHAGLCSLAVCTCEPGSYQQFFKDKEMVSGHSFTEVSLSRLRQDRYLIARQDDSIIYLGFQSEPLLLEWSKQFKSFSEGGIMFNIYLRLTLV